MKTERNIIGMAGTFPIYDCYGEGVTVVKVEDENGGEAYEISVPRRPKIGGGVRKEIKYVNTVIEYAEASAERIRKKKQRGRWT